MLIAHAGTGGGQGGGSISGGVGFVSELDGASTGPLEQAGG